MSAQLKLKSVFVATLAAGALLAGAAFALEPGEFALTAYDKDGNMVDEAPVSLTSDATYNGTHFSCKSDPDTTYYNTEAGGKKMSIDWYSQRYKMVVETMNEAGERVPVCEFTW